MPFFYRDVTTFASPNGTVRFNDPTGLGDYHADQAWLDGLDGWTTTVKPVVVSSQRAVGDGAYLAKKFYSQGRVFMARGLVATNTKVDTEAAWNDLVSIAFPLNEDITITNLGSVIKTTTVRVISDVRCTQLMEDGFRFEVDLMSEESYLYSVNDISATAGIVGSATGGMTFPMTFPLEFNIDPQGASNSAIVTNIGNAPSRPVITIAGPLDAGWRLENTTSGEFIAFDKSLAGTSNKLVIDFKKQTAIIGNSTVAGLLEGDWWDIVPGANIIKLFGTYYGATTFTVSTKSAWR